MIAVMLGGPNPLRINWWTTMKTNKATFAVRAVCFVIAMLSGPPVFGEEDEHESATSHEANHDYHRNLLSVFVGHTGVTRREHGNTLGIGYERRVTKTVSVGALVERTYGDLDFRVYAVPFAYHAGPWKIFVAPGVEDSDHGSELLVRMGAEYAFEVGSWEIAPQLSIDFVDGEQLGIIGIALAKGF